MTNPAASDAHALHLTAEQCGVVRAAVAGLHAQCVVLAAQAREGSKTQEQAVLIIGHCLALERRLAALAERLSTTQPGQTKPGG